MGARGRGPREARGQQLCKRGGLSAVCAHRGGLNEDVHIPTLLALLPEMEGMSEQEQKAFLHAHYYDLIPRHIVPDDMVASVSYLIGMPYGIGHTDDIDHTLR